MGKSAVTSLGGANASASAAAVAEDVCWTASIEGALTAALAAHRGAWLAVDFTTADGVTRTVPVVAQAPQGAAASPAAGAVQAAAAGARDVVVLLDVSGSVGAHGLRADVLALADALLQRTLALGDFAAVLAVTNRVRRLRGSSDGSGVMETPVDTDADAAESDVLELVTADTRFDLRRAVCRHGTGGGSLLEPAFRAATALLARSHAAGRSTGCGAHLVLVTDGTFQARPMYLAQAFHAQAAAFENATQRRLHLHAYSLSPHANTAFLREFTCRHRGIAVDVAPLRRTGKDSDTDSDAGVRESMLAESAALWSTFVARQRTAARQGRHGTGAARELAWSDVHYAPPLAQTLATVAAPVYAALAGTAANSSSRSSDYLVGVVAAHVFAAGLADAVAAGDVPAFARNATQGARPVAAYLAYRGATHAGARCHAYAPDTRLEQALRRELAGYTCSAAELGPANASTSSSGGDADVVLASEAPLEPSGTAVERCAAPPARTGDALWANAALANYSRAHYDAARCPRVPAGCAVYNGSRVQHRSDAELRMLLHCRVSPAARPVPLRRALAAAALAAVLLAARHQP